MRLVVKGECLHGRANRTRHLPALFDFAVRGLHDVLIHPAAQNAWLAWLEQRDPVLREVYRRAEQDSHGRQALAPSDVAFFVADPDDSNWEGDQPELHVLDALDLMALPLEILVEDETSDGAFLDAVAPPVLRNAWMDARARRRLAFGNTGGITQVPRRLQGERAHPPRSIRSFVLIDSDAPEPWLDVAQPRENSWNNLPRDARDAAAAARGTGIPVHVLDRRMAENYLPPEALRAWVMGLPRAHQVNKLPHVEQFETLPRQRQHHHHLKSGLRPTELSLYGPLSQQAQAALEFSLGSSTWEAFQHATKADLRAYGVYAELSPLFQRLLGVL